MTNCQGVVRSFKPIFVAFLLAIASLSSLPVQALVSKISENRYLTYTAYGGVGTGSSPESACAAAAANTSSDPSQFIGKVEPVRAGDHPLWAGYCRIIPASDPTTWRSFYQIELVMRCPDNSSHNNALECICNEPYSDDLSATGCYLPADVKVKQKQANKPPAGKTNESKQSCPAPGTVKVGDPIYPLTGTERLPVEMSITVGGVALRITYDTAKQKAAAAAGVAPKDFGDAPSFGGLWMSSLHRRLDIGAGDFGINAHRGDGHIVSFSYNTNTGSYTTDADSTDQLNFIPGTNQLTFIPGTYLLSFVPGTYQLLLGQSKSIETYNIAGQLIGIATAQGNTLSFSYSDTSTPVTTAPAPGYLLSVTDNTARTVRFEYTLAAGGVAATDARITKVTDPAGQTIMAGYDTAGNLTALNWANGTSRQFVYENSALPWALTGVIDENNSRFATIGYDAAGNATSTELAGGVDKYVVSYATPPQVNRTQLIQPATGFTQETSNWSAPSAPQLAQPNGSTSSLGSTTVQGMNLVSSMSQPAGSGCAASTSAQTYDVNANITSRDDFSGQRTCYAYDTKNQETTRVEGLANTVACTTVLSANAVLPANARKTTTTYHPDWRMPATVTMPGSITTSIYHGQPDPFNGNAVANCTPAANLPNGKPLPLLCKQVIQATLSSGALDSTVANTVTRYTYNAAGKVLTATDSLNRATTYAYYPSTAFTGTDPNAVGNTTGDLLTITNPAGFVTTFNAYDKTGRILKTTDPKGIVTDMTYTPRGWVSTVTTTAPGQSARTTRYTYDGVGQLTGVSNPDGSTLAYTYDAAHRLTGATDAKGNSVTYTLDNMGNRIKEDIKDPSGVLQRSINRSFDALNRLQQVSGAVQ